MKKPISSIHSCVAKTIQSVPNAYISRSHW